MDVIEIARKEVGYIEQEGNYTKYGKWFGVDGVAWCAMFVSWCYDQAGKNLGNLSYKNGFAGCQAGYEAMKKLGWITDKPVAGDIVFFDWNSDGRYDHVGLFVEDSEWDHRFISIEGNTSTKNDSNGGSVMQRSRKYSNCIFAHPNV